MLEMFMTRKRFSVLTVTKSIAKNVIEIDMLRTAENIISNIIEKVNYVQFDKTQDIRFIIM